MSIVNETCQKHEKRLIGTFLKHTGILSQNKFFTSLNMTRKNIPLARVATLNPREKTSENFEPQVAIGRFCQTYFAAKHDCHEVESHSTEVKLGYI